MKAIALLISAFFIFLFLIPACTKDHAVEPAPCHEDASFNPDSVTYTKDIKPILESACALSECHVTGFGNGDFTSYADIKDKADFGILNQRLFIDKTMPYFTTTGPKHLTSCQLERFRIWIAKGAPL